MQLASDSRTRELVVIGGAVLASSALGVAAGTTGSPRLLVVGLVLVVAAAVGTYAIARPWGIAVPLAPALLVPTLPGMFGITPMLLTACGTLALSVAWWSAGAGQPTPSKWAIASAAGVGVFSVGANFAGAHGLQQSLAIPALWIAGVLLGAGTAKLPKQASFGIALVVAPTAALALVEAFGVPNFWAQAINATRFEETSGVEGATRSTATYVHPLVAGAVLAASALLFFRNSTRWGPAVGCLCIGGALATVSRSAMLGLLAAGVTVLWLERRRAPQLLAVIVLVAAAAGAAILFVPAINESFSARVTDSNEVQYVRGFAFEDTVRVVRTNPQTVAIGQGIGGSTRALEERGGLYGFVTLDNQYATAVYDFGLLLMCLLLVSGALVLRGGAADNRAWAIPPLICMTVVLAFVDGLYWASFSLMLGLIVGIAGAPAAEKSGA